MGFNRIMGSLQGKKVWLTGASSGIGRALAFELNARGADCALTARSSGDLERVAANLATGDSRVAVLPGDVTDLAAMKQVAESADRALGGIDMLIANAGTHIPTRPGSFSSAEYLGLMDINFGGMLRCIEAALPYVRRSNQGSIVGVSSMAGYRGLPSAAAYGASKAAMTHFLESLRFHLEHERLSVTVVSPGFVRTPLTDKNDFRMPFLIEADVAAKKICNGLERKRREISFPVPFNWSMKLMRAAPFAVYHNIIQKFVWKEELAD